MMMSMLYHSLKIKPSDKLKEEDKMIIETYSKSVDFTDFEVLKAITEEINNN